MTDSLTTPENATPENGPVNIVFLHKYRPNDLRSYWPRSHGTHIAQRFASGRIAQAWMLTGVRCG